MKWKRHNTEQVVAKLREADAMLTAGASPARVCLRLEISEATIHPGQSRNGGMKAKEARRHDGASTHPPPRRAPAAHRLDSGPVGPWAADETEPCAWHASFAAD